MDSNKAKVSDIFERNCHRNLAVDFASLSKWMLVQKMDVSPVMTFAATFDTKGRVENGFFGAIWPRLTFKSIIERGLIL